MSDIKDREAVDRAVPDADVSADRPSAASVEPLVAHLQGLHPEASQAMVERSIDDATAMFVHARVRLFLPILIERMASARLRAALGPDGDTGGTRRPAGPALDVTRPARCPSITTTCTEEHP